MNPVTARANPGTLIQLDQCPQCGGIWCDKWELFPIDAHESARLDPVDEKLLRAPGPPSAAMLYCPRCTAKLQVFKEPLLPKEIQFQRCRRCEGIWLNRGQLSRYKSHQKKTRREKMGVDSSAQIAEAYQDPKSWVVMGTKGIFVYPQAPAEEPPLEDSLGGVFRLILQTLVRMVLGI
jgi:Zn-finger nucleic acid-binding protein